VGLHLLFVIREDHVAELDGYAQSLPDAFRIRYHLDALRQEQAALAIREPAQLCGFTFGDGVLKTLIKDLRTVPVQTREGVVDVVGEFVEPLHLQVVCRSLFSKLPSGRMLITHDDVHAFADVDEALAHFYNSAVARTVRETRVSEGKLRKWFDTEIITAAGTRGIVFAGGRLAGSIDLRAAEVLEREKVLRPEPRAGATWYELTHDRFIGPIRESNHNWYRARSRRIARLTLSAVVVILVALVVALVHQQRKTVQQAQNEGTQRGIPTGEASRTTGASAATASCAGYDPATAGECCLCGAHTSSSTRRGSICR